MKISSASKKVLASALSAAMVVAFAPTVALAAPAQGDYAKIHFEVQTGANATIANPSVSIADQNVLLNSEAKTGDISVENTSNFEYYGANISGWWYDKDADGVMDSNEQVGTSAGKITSFEPANSFKSGDTITLKAIYALPSVTAPDTVAEGVTDGVTAFTVSVVTAGTYDVKVTRNGEEIFSKANVALGANQLTFQAATTAADFNTVSAGVAKFDASKYGEGKYVVTLTDQGTNKGYAATCEFEICKVSLKTADPRVTITASTTTFYVIKGGSLTGTMIPGEAATRTDHETFSGWAYADGTLAQIGNVVKENVELTAAFADPTVKKPVADLVHKKISFAFSNLDYTDEDAKTASQVKDYTAKVEGPGVSMTLSGGTHEYDSNHKNNYDENFNLNLNYSYSTSDGQWNSNVYTSAAPQAGTYTVTLTQVNGDGSTKVIGSSSVELVAVSYDLGEGNWKDARGKDITAEVLESLPTVAVKGGAMNNVWSADTLANKVETPGTAEDSVDAFDKWTVSGVEDADGKAVTKLADGEDNVSTLFASTNKVTGEVKLTATYKVAYAAAPAATFEGDVMTVAAAEGTTAYYEINNSNSWVAYTAPVTLAASDSSVEIKSYAGTLVSKEITYTKVKAANENDYTTAKSTIAALTDFKTTADYMGNLDVYKTAVATADATYGVWRAADDWTDVKVAAIGTVLGSYADVAEEAIDSYVAGVTQTDGSLKKLPAQKAANLKASIAAVEAAWAKGKSPSEVVDFPVYSADSSGRDYNVASYVSAIKWVVFEAQFAMLSYTKADVDAAAAVTTSLKAAKDIDTAKAAVEAYNGLTEAQKELVAVADVQAACQVIIDAKDATIAEKDAAAVKAAEEAAAAAAQYAEQIAAGQDQLAATQLTGKKVVAKAKVGKKAQGKKFSYKLAASDSGNVATFTKTGSKKIKVSAAGKVTFVKVKAAKKAKTYKAKVTVAFGAATKTVTVKYVVAGK